MFFGHIPSSAFLLLVTWLAYGQPPSDYQVPFSSNEAIMGNLRIGAYLAFVSKFWAVEDVITRSRTASGHVDGADDLLWPKVECVEEELAMPLTTTSEPGYYEPSTDNIGFWMLNGTRERQRCAVTLEALEKLKTGLLRGIAEQIRCFNTNRKAYRTNGKREVR